MEKFFTVPASAALAHGRPGLDSRCTFSPAHFGSSWFFPGFAGIFPNVRESPPVGRPDWIQLSPFSSTCQGVFELGGRSWRGRGIDDVLGVRTWYACVPNGDLRVGFGTGRRAHPEVRNHSWPARRVGMDGCDGLASIRSGLDPPFFCRCLGPVWCLLKGGRLSSVRSVQQRDEESIPAILLVRGCLERIRKLMQLGSQRLPQPLQGSEGQKQDDGTRSCCGQT